MQVGSSIANSTLQGKSQATGDNKPFGTDKKVSFNFISGSKIQ